MDWPEVALMAWYTRHGRHALLWRQTRDPYAVLVSEVMLQQTQVDRVLPYYEAWLARWPTAVSLADAPLPEVLRAWAGLGYNRRAVHLHRAAVAAVARFEGIIPVDPAALRTLPGVGPYTAAAVASFAGERRAAPADTNIGRVLARAVHAVAAVKEVSAARLGATALALLPEDGTDARDHNLALMDLGALVCDARQPACESCPLRDACAWRVAGSLRPQAPSKPAARFEETARFARGRIVDSLRAARALTQSELAATLPEAHRATLGRYLQALERDGVVEGEGGSWWLAGHSGSSTIASPKE